MFVSGCLARYEITWKTGLTGLLAPDDFRRPVRVAPATLKSEKQGATPEGADTL